MVRLAQGDLAGARDVIRKVPAEVEPTTLVANLATYWDLFWVLDDDQQQLLLRLPPSAFDDDRGAWGIALAADLRASGRPGRARAYADSAVSAFEEQIKATPDNPQLYVLQGTVLAYAGRKADAIREGKLAVELLPISKDAYQGAYIQHQLARIYILVGRAGQGARPARAAAQDPVLPLARRGSGSTPTFDPLRKNPRFQKLVEGTR